jgi:hypothetical protein
MALPSDGRLEALEAHSQSSSVRLTSKSARPLWTSLINCGMLGIAQEVNDGRLDMR